MTGVIPLPAAARPGARPVRLVDVPPAERGEDEALVERARTGDSSAFDSLVRKYSPRLYALVYHMTAHREDSYDLLQEVFAKAYQNLPSFRGDSAFYTWIYSITLNLTRNFLKRRGRRQTYSLEELDSSIDSDRIFNALVASSDPVRETDLRDLQRKLNEALQRLSDDHRAVVTMFDIQGIPHAEIGRILGVSTGTVRSRLHYAHRQLQALLADYLR